MFIDGLIGAGKTTFLKKYEDLSVIYEPVEEWVASGKLEKFYSNQEIYAFEWQEYVLTTFIDHIRKNLQGKFVLVERGHVSAFRIFTYMFWQDKKITDFQYFYLKKLHDDFNNEIINMGYTSSYVYLDTDIDVCMQRVEDRNRQGETVKKSFQQRLLNRFNEIFTKRYSPGDLDSLISVLS